MQIEPSHCSSTLWRSWVAFTDGHRRTIIEHILHIQFLPGLQRSTDTGWISHPLTSEASQLSLSVPNSTLPYQHSHQTRSNLGQSSSPLHLHLPIITRLSFNDAGRITHHRDFWDIKVRMHRFPYSLSACRGLISFSKIPRMSSASYLE